MFSKSTTKSSLFTSHHRTLKHFSVNNFTKSKANIFTSTLPRRVTLVEGDGIGPEIIESVVGVFAAAQTPVVWERFQHVPDESSLDDLIISLSRNGVGLKGPLHTPVTKGYMSRNWIIAKNLDLFANVVEIKNIPGIQTKHKNLDFVVIRENTEGEYTGLEHTIAPGIVQSLKVITRDASIRIASFAFQYARDNNRKKVTAIHKANIQKLSDGQFLECCAEVSKQYPEIKYDQMIIDNTSMQLVMNPGQFDVMVTPNLYGNIIQNIGAGLVGGPGLLAGSTFGLRGAAIFESGARHVGKDIEGQNIADPIGTLFAGVSLLRYIKLNDHANLIHQSVSEAIQEGKCLTPDIGGNSTTREFTKSVIDRIETNYEKFISK